jgi:hypothetical protein
MVVSRDQEKRKKSPGFPGIVGVVQIIGSVQKMGVLYKNWKGLFE